MRLLHFSDLHLGVVWYGRPDPETGLNSRLLDFLRVLDEVVDFALREEVDLVLFCGDAYRSQRPEPTEQREFALRIARLVSHNIPIFILIGNHDLPHAIGRATAVEVFDALKMPGVTVARKPGIYHMATRAGTLQVLALPWLRPSALLAQEEARGMGLGELDALLRDKLENIVQHLAQQVNPELPAVMAAHCSLDTAQPSSERTMVLGQEPFLRQSNIALPVFSYIAMGHMHRKQELSQNPPIVYSGSLERLDFSDEGVEKGFYVVDIEKGEARFKFRPVKARPFFTLELPPPGQVWDEANLTPLVLREIGRRANQIKDAIVRVEITTHPGIQLDTREVMRALQEAYHASSPFIYIKGTPRPRLANDFLEGLTPLKALQLYLELKKTPPGRAEKLVGHARRLLEEES